MKQIKSNYSRLAVLFFFLFIQITTTQSQDTGEVRGVILDSVEAIIGGMIVVEGNNKLGSFTDEFGGFMISKIPPGTYTLLISNFGYKPKSILDVKIEAGKSTSIGTVYLESDIEETKEIIIMGTRSTNSERAAITETKESKQIVNIISAEQISKSQDRDAAQVMQRVPGVTIIDNRFVMIRGLSERYNMVMINDVIAPNTEAERRSFSFDLIPSQMLDRMSIYKTGTAENPGDFAAGVIKVYTKNMPDRNYFNVSMTGGYRNGTTFKDFNKNYSGKTEFLGFGDKSRNLSSDFPTNSFLNSNKVTDIEKQQAALLLPNRFGYTTTKALPDLRFNVDMGRRFSIGKVKVGNVTAISYSNTNQSQFVERTDYSALDSTTGRLAVRSNYKDYQTANSVRLGVIHNWSLVLTPNSKIDFKNLFNQQGQNETTLRSGIQPEDRISDSINAYSYRYTARSIVSSQLGGRHDFNENRTNFSWNIGYSYISQNVPDWIRFRTYNKIGANDPSTVIIPSSATLFEAARFNSSLKESVITTSGALEHKFYKEDSTGISIKAGYYIETRSREFAARWLSYKSLQAGPINDSILTLPIDQVFSSTNVGNAQGFKIEEVTNPSDKYTAGNELYAGFLQTLIPVKRFTFQIGLRVEAYHQKLTSATSSEKIEIDTFLISPLPFINSSYNLSKKSLIRLAYSRTLNRAEFRELAPFLYYDFALNTNFLGNPKLKMCSIDNLDLRYEFYPSANEMISIGAFYKHFKNPIEINSRGGYPRQFEFANAQSATNYGLELDIRKSLKDLSSVKIIQDLSLLLNASVIKSRVNFDSSGIVFAERALQGQSPYVINTGLYYNNEEKGLSISALYNIFGKRIFVVGDNNQGVLNNPNIYEMPRHSIDLTLQKKFTDKWEGRIGIQDLLNYKTRFINDTDGNGKIDGNDDNSIITRRGTYITAGIQFKF